MIDNDDTHITDNGNSKDIVSVDDLVLPLGLKSI